MSRFETFNEIQLIFKLIKRYINKKSLNRCTLYEQTKLHPEYMVHQMKISMLGMGDFLMNYWSGRTMKDHKHYRLLSLLLIAHHI